jgi:hypothetical protein
MLHSGPIPWKHSSSVPKCHLLVCSNIKTKVTGITSCDYSLEHILLGKEKEASVLGLLT